MRCSVPVALCGLVALALPSAALGQHVTIHVTSMVTIENQTLVRSPHHPTKGDVIEFRDLLLNRGAALFGKRNGRAVAWDEGIVRYTSTTGELIHVRVIFPFLGSFDYEGLLGHGPGGTNVIPIVAATGAFKGVRGTVTIGPGTGSAENTFDLTLPGDPLELSSGGDAA